LGVPCPSVSGRFDSQIFPFGSKKSKPDVLTSLLREKIKATAFFPLAHPVVPGSFLPGNRLTGFFAPTKKTTGMKDAYC